MVYDQHAYGDHGTIFNPCQELFLDLQKGTVLVSDINTRNARLFSFLESKQVLIIKPDLAVEIGLNEAILLQQINYWISNPLNKNLRDGRVWVHKTYSQWEQEFPFWSYNTIRRTIESLESQSLIISTQKYNSECKDQTKWYTLNNSLEVCTTAQNGHPPLPKMGSCTFK